MTPEELRARYNSLGPIIPPEPETIDGLKEIMYVIRAVKQGSVPVGGASDLVRQILQDELTTAYDEGHDDGYAAAMERIREYATN